jgi:hypothetical protein
MLPPCEAVMSVYGASMPTCPPEERETPKPKNAPNTRRLTFKMTSDQYVLEVLWKYEPSGRNIPYLRSALVPVIRQWAGKYLTNVIPSAYFAKGTAIRHSTDVDFPIALSSTMPGTLEQLSQMFAQNAGRL